MTKVFVGQPRLHRVCQKLWLINFFKSGNKMLYFQTRAYKFKVHLKRVNLWHQMVTLVKNMYFQVCPYKSKNLARSQLNFVWMPDHVYLTIINSDFVLHYKCMDYNAIEFHHKFVWKKTLFQLYKLPFFQCRSKTLIWLKLTFSIFFSMSIWNARLFWKVAFSRYFVDKSQYGVR